MALLKWFALEIEDNKLTKVTYSGTSIIHDDHPQAYTVYENGLRTRAKDELHAYTLITKYLEEQAGG